MNWNIVRQSILTSILPDKSHSQKESFMLLKSKVMGPSLVSGLKSQQLKIMDRMLVSSSETRSLLKEDYLEEFDSEQDGQDITAGSLL